MTLETKRLILRPFEERDAADAFEYLSDPKVHCFACMKVNSLEEARRAVLERAKEQDYYFAITLKDTGKVIGEIDAMPESGEPHQDDNAVLDTFSPCWMLNPNYFGKGYAYEAAYAFFDYLFTLKGARRIYAYTEDYNVASQKLCTRLGMRQEGLFREFISFVNDENGNPIYENTYQYAILKREWENAKTQKKIAQLKQLLKDRPLNEDAYSKMLQDLDELDTRYGDKMRTAPIDADAELKRVPNADFSLCGTLLTMLLREDHFCEGSLIKRIEKGDVALILERMIHLLQQGEI